VAPKVASAPRGPGTGRLAGYLVQSLPEANRPFGHFLFAISQSIHVGFSSLFFTPLSLGILPANRLFFGIQTNPVAHCSFSTTFPFSTFEQPCLTPISILFF
jgi:hypothetical protein